MDIPMIISGSIIKANVAPNTVLSPYYKLSKGVAPPTQEATMPAARIGIGDQRSARIFVFFACFFRLFIRKKRFYTKYECISIPLCFFFNFFERVSFIHIKSTVFLCFLGEHKMQAEPLRRPIITRGRGESCIRPFPGKNLLIFRGQPSEIVIKFLNPGLVFINFQGSFKKTARFFHIQ
jgi:hypothetical protein